MKKKKTATKVKNGGKTKSVMVKSPLYHRSTTSTTLPLEKYPYTFIKYKTSIWERIRNLIYG